MNFRRTLVLLTAIFTLSSCDFFTTSVGKSFARDNSQRYSNQSASDLISLASSPEAMNDPDSSAQILASLGQKDNLTDLSAEEKDTVLDLMIGSTITADSISNLISNMDDFSNSDNMIDVLDDMISSISEVDTAAVASLLSDTDSLDEMDPASAILASMCLIAQVAKTEDAFSNLEDIESNISGLNGSSDFEDVAESILGAGASDSSVTALAAAFSCFGYYSDPENSERAATSIFGDTSISDLLNAFGN